MVCRLTRKASYSLRISGLILVIVSMGAVRSLQAAPTLYNWLQFDGNPQHDSNNRLETLITPTTVANLKPLFSVQLPDTMDGAPAALSNVATSGGTRNLLFVTTRQGTIAALDAHTGALVWSHANPPGDCRINQDSGPCYTTSSPAIDPNGQFVYSYGLDGYVHKYQVTDGTEIKDNGWPELTTTKPYNEKGSSALSLAVAPDGTPYLYMAQAGYPGDRGDYQGHLTTINLKTGARQVFNAACSDQTVHFVEKPGTPDCPSVQTAIWARPGAVYDIDTQKLYVATGNGTFDPAKHDWGDSVLALNPDGTGANGDPLDSYTPANFDQLAASDADLGSAEPAILPAPPTSKIRHIGLQASKDLQLRLLDLDKLSGSGQPGATGGDLQTIPVPQGGQVLPQPAVWVNPADQSTWVFISNPQGISALQLTASPDGTPTLQVAWKQTRGGTSPLIAGGVLFVAKSNNIRAFDPLTGKTLWQDTAIGELHWQSPVVVNGVLYIGDNGGALHAYTLP